MTGGWAGVEGGVAQIQVDHWGICPGVRGKVSPCLRLSQICTGYSAGPPGFLFQCKLGLH